MAPSVAPPTPQEIQRKLSVHSASRTKPSTSSTTSGTGPSTVPGTSWPGGGLISGTESDSDSILTPDITAAHVGFNPPSASLMQPPLSSIAERSPGSGGEDSDEEEDLAEGDGAGWRPGSDGLRASGTLGPSRGADVVLKSGYLSKKGERRKTWKKRWFVLRPTHLAFYKNHAEYKLLRLLELNDVHSCIPVQLKRHSNTFGLILPKRTYYLQAGSPKDVSDWVEAIEDARQSLMASSTINSAHNASATVPVSTPIPIPPSAAAWVEARPPPMSISPNNPNPVSSSDSEDALSQLAPPPPLNFSLGGSVGGGNGGGGGGTLIAPSPTSVSFGPLHKPTPAPPAQKETSKIILSGYLMKCGSKRRNWRKRWFVLTAEKLFYSRSHMDTKPHRVFSFSDILDAMDYDLPTHRNHHNHSTHNHIHHGTAASSLTPSLSTSPPSQLSSVGGGTNISIHATSTHAPNTTGANLDYDLDLSNQQRNFAFKIVMTKRNLLLCAPSEEDEIKWLGAVRALIARRSGSGVLPGQQHQQVQQVGSPGSGVAEGSTGGSGVPGGGGGGIKSKVRRLSAGPGVLGGSSGKSTTIATSMSGTGAVTGTGTGTGGIDESRETH